MSHLFERAKTKEEFPEHSVIVRSSGHRHVVIDIDALLETTRGGGGGSGAPVVDGATGTVVAIAHPDPVDGVYTYVDPRTTVVEEHSGQGRSVVASGALTVRAVIDTPTPTTAPPEDILGPEPQTDVEEAPLTRPRCTGADCFVTVGCNPGFGSATHITPQPLFSPTNLGSTALLVMFAGPPQPPHGKRAVLQEVEIGPGLTGPNLIPPTGTDTIFLGCSGGGSVTFRFSAGVA